MPPRRLRLVQARKAAGYTQEALAEALNVERSTINRWEAGRYAPLPYVQPRLARLLGINANELADMLAEGTAMAGGPLAGFSLPDHYGVPSDDMKRRTLIKWGVATTGAAGLGVRVGASVGLSDVTRLKATAARLHTLDQRHGGEALWQSAVAYAQDGLYLLEQGRYTENVGNALLRATGELHVCAGWLAFDAGQQDVARTCYADALSIARQADDPLIETRALANLALQSNALSRPREAQRYAHGAEQAAARFPARSWLSAIPQLRLAMASSIMGDAKGTDQALTRARRVLDVDSNAVSAEWSSFLSPYEIDAVEATCDLALRRAPRASGLLERALAGYRDQLARNTALYHVRLSQARLDSGEAEGAAEAACAALDDFSGDLASWRVSSELNTVAAGLSAHADIDGVSRFLTRYQTAAC